MHKYRMIHVDSYMCKPVAPFDDLRSEVSGCPTAKVPVIRIFGADSNGCKICLHVHGFYPYVAIQNRDPSDKELAKKIVQDIERALGALAEENVRLRNQRQQQQQQPQAAGQSNQAGNQAGEQAGADVVAGTSAPGAATNGARGLPTDVIEQDGDSNLLTRLHQERTPVIFLGPEQKAPVHKIETIKAYNYYGYHHEPEDFFKLHLYNPRMVKQLAQLFEDCKVLGRFIPVFWAHLPYVLLFFIDNNLRGMQFIEVDQPYWRRDRAPPGPSQQRFSPVSRPNTSASSHSPSATSPTDQEAFITDIEPISSCELEADVRYEWILNKQRFGSKGNDDALRELWLDDQEATQATSLIDSKLPLFSLEREYINQLCELFEIDVRELDLELAERPSLSQVPMLPAPSFNDSDDSLDGLLQEREELPPENDEEEFGSGRTSSAGREHPGPLQDTAPAEDDEFSDDEEFLKQLPRLVTAIKSEIDSQVRVKQEPGCSSTNVAHVKLEAGPAGIKQEPQTQPQVRPQEEEEGEDEFSDDDQLFMEAIRKTESQDLNLKSQRQPSQPEPRQLQSAVKNRRRFSDNSIIDGRSIVCSTENRSKAGSQHSTSSSRETVSHEFQYFCLMSMEVHATTRGKLRPDPAFDPIEAMFYCVRNDVPERSSKPGQVIGMLITDPFRGENLPAASAPESLFTSPTSVRSNMSLAQKMRTLLNRTGLSMKDIELHVVDTELELIMSLVEVVKQHDPEILIGYEMELLSWGYVLERATVLGISLGPALSRVSEANLSHNSKFVESNFVQPIMFTGRMVFSTWRIIKHEINLNTCSYERIHHHALGERVPCFAFETLTGWFNQHHNRWRVIDYYLVRVAGQMRILDKFDLIAKVSELARVYGTQFIDVITRGSQIGIESMMLRLAKLQNLVPLSPTVMQRHKMMAPEALPLVMEPETNIYYDPVAVLDFQSLYPSVVIAYNYCYSTCLGRVMDLEKRERHQFGCSQLQVDEQELKRLLASNSVHVSPCGVAFVKKNVRHGILPKMLSELIVTRAMVKDQMKKNMKSERPNRRLQRILDHRQHGLKMMANTTYGYAGASYTGRMPCVEIADSIVSKGRETLEMAIELVESRAEWGAKVIYGDTDSMFIQFQNCDKDTAFKRSYEMVEAITRANPHPIKMKFEKIYQPCVLQTKKRYCGFKYEFPDQARPEFEAKGIETVRRDCCPAAARMLEMALRIQFTTRDVDQVKRYVQHQFIKIMSGKLSNVQDFIFARQYKPRDLDKSESVFVPAWQIAKRFLAYDPRAEPRLNERVPYVIVYGEPRTPLVNLAKTPMEMLENLSCRVNADHYIQKIICPTLNRVFCTLKVDTLLWYKSMPHQNIIHRSHYLIAQRNQGGSGPKQATMSQYFSPSHCPVCAKSIPISDDICDECHKRPQASVVRLTEEIARNQRKLFVQHQICRACSSLERPSGEDHPGGANQRRREPPSTSQDDAAQHYNPCISYDCQNLFRYHQAKLDAANSNFLSQVLKSLN